MDDRNSKFHAQFASRNGNCNFRPNANKGVAAVHGTQNLHNSQTSRPNTLYTFAQKLPENGHKIAKSSKKVNKVPLTRPALEIYRPPVLRQDLSMTKSSEDLSTKPHLAAGSKQQSSNKNDFKRNSTEYLRQHGTAYHPNYNNLQLQQNKMHYKSRTFSQHKSAENLRPQNYHQQQQYAQNALNDVQDKSQRRSLTPPPQFGMTGHQFLPNQKGVTSNGHNFTMKRSGSFVKDLPKKKTFGAKEAQEAKSLLAVLDIANDETIEKWVSENFESAELATPVGQLLVQMAIENSKSPKTVGKLCALLIECPTGEYFHKGLIASSLQYYDCRVKLKLDHFRFWLSFITCLSELYANLGFTYEGELVQILLQVYNYLLQPTVLEEIKIEELECLISSLLSVGYNLERQCPDKLSEVLSQLRDGFIEAHEPWIRKMLLLMIELCASDWKLPPEANTYYFQTQYSSISSSS